MVNEDKVTDKITILARERFPGAEILGVQLAEDLDHEESAILRIRIIYANKNGLLDPDATAGFPRHLRPTLDELGIQAFPIMSFVSAEDAEDAA